MDALKRKWNSRQGATILMALLFLLVSVLVGASLVMAAASNVGKVRSNKDEQQKYLTLSSAMTLLVEELQSVEYVGNYHYEYKLVPVTRTEMRNGDFFEYIEYNHYYTYTMKKGALLNRNPDDPATLNPDPEDRNKDWADDMLHDVLALRADLDRIFAKRFTRAVQDEKGRHKPNNKYNVYHYKYVYDQEDFGKFGYDYNQDGYVQSDYEGRTASMRDTRTPAVCSYELVIQVDGFQRQQVRVNVSIEDLNECIIVLHASLEEARGEDGEAIEWVPAGYTMQAVLTPNVRADSLDIKWNLPDSGDYSTEEHVNWTLDYIFKEATGTDEE